MPYLIGLTLSAGVAMLGRHAGLERDRAFYSTVLMVVASYYVLFAAMSSSIPALLVESAVMTAFVVAAVVGFRSSPWLVAAALAGHGIFDAVHGFLVANPGVPVWWPAFCLSFDVGAGAYLAWLLWRRARRVDG